MDANLRIIQDYRLEHHHNDGSWFPLERVGHDAVDHDPERSWIKRAIYRCECGEEVALIEDVSEEQGRPES